MEKCSINKLFPLTSPFQKFQDHLIWTKIEGLVDGSFHRFVLARFESNYPFPFACLHVIAAGSIMHELECDSIMNWAQIIAHASMHQSC